MAIVTESTVAQTTRDLFIDGDTIVVLGNRISKNPDGVYIILESKRIELKSMGRNSNNTNVGPVKVSYNNEIFNTVADFKIADRFQNGKKIIVSPDSITQIVWGIDTLKLKLQSKTDDEPTVCDLILDKNEIILNNSTSRINNGISVINSPKEIIVKSMKLKELYKDRRDVIVTQIGDTISQLYKAEGQSWLSAKSTEKLFSIQPGKKILITWGDKSWVIDSQDNTQPTVTDLILGNWHWLMITMLMATVVIVLWKHRKQKHLLKQNKEKIEKEVLQRIIKDNPIDEITSIDKLIEWVVATNESIKSPKSDSNPKETNEPQSPLKPSSGIGSIDTNPQEDWRTILSKHNLIVDLGINDLSSIENVFSAIEEEFINRENETKLIKKHNDINLNHNKKLCEKNLHINEALKMQKNKDYTIESILSTLEKALCEIAIPKRSLDDIIKSPTAEEKFHLKSYVREWLKDKWNKILPNSNIDDIRNQLLWLEDMTNDDKLKIEALVLKTIESRLELHFSDVDDLVDKWEVSGHTDIQLLLLKTLQKITGSKAENIDSVLEELKSKAVETISRGKTVGEINTAIKEHDEVKNLVEKYQKNTANELEEAIESSVIKRISDRIQLDEEDVEKYDNLKSLILSIKKSDSADKLANALFLHLYGICQTLNTLNTSKKQAEENKVNAETMVIEKVKDQYKLIFKDELNTDTPLKAINYFAERVEEAINLKDGEINKLTNDINTEKQALEQVQTDLLAEQEALKYMYKTYADFIASTFEKIKRNIQQSLNGRDKSAPLVRKIHECIISNDSWGLSDFVDDIKKITDANLDVDTMKKEVKTLFIRCLKFSSWIDILAQIYLYIQEPTLAHKLAVLGLDTAAVNKAFILTELAMGIVGIKLQYPKLFTDTFDGSYYDEDSLSEIQDLIGNISDLVGSRTGLIIDLLRVGYSVDDAKQKAIIVRFN